MVFGWFGYKAFRRIEAWGRNMNEIDGIFQKADPQDGGWSPRASNKPTPRGMTLVPTLKTPHHHA
jgi:hypothetical protein